MNAITDKQLGLLRHTLGVTPKRREPYRNHFVAGPGHHDQADLEALEAAELMERAPTPKFMDADDVVFRCTAAGRAYAIDNLPLLPKQSKWEDYLDADYGHSFAEWLGIERPRVECHHPYGRKPEYRVYRSPRDWLGETMPVRGEWKPTKKEAKANYKEALRQRRSVMQKGGAA